MDIPFWRMGATTCHNHFVEQKARSLQHGPLQPTHGMARGVIDGGRVFLEVREITSIHQLFCSITTSNPKMHKT